MAEPSRSERPFSVKYSAPLHRWKMGVPQPKYAKLTSSSIPCDECFALQHETRGAYGPRHSAKERRVLAATQQRDGSTINLCRGHAAIWHERDEADRAAA